MSNRRRKTIGSQKIKRNLLIRIARGCRHHNTDWPGDGRTYNPDKLPDGWQLSADLHNRGQQHRNDMQTHVTPYWRGR